MSQLISFTVANKNNKNKNSNSSNSTLQYSSPYFTSSGVSTAASPQWHRPELLHTGQLRFHSFNKLREIHYQRIFHSLSHARSHAHTHTHSITSGNSLLNMKTTLGSSANTSTATRNISMRNILRMTLGYGITESEQQLKQLERQAMENLRDAAAQHKFESQLVRHDPNAVVEWFQRPDRRNAAMTVDSAIMYLQLLHSQNKLASLDVDNVLKRLKLAGNPDIQNDYRAMINSIISSSSNSGTPGIDRKLSKTDHAQYLYQFLVTGGVVAANASPGSIAGDAVARLGSGTGALLGRGGIANPGATPTNPVHVNVVRGGAVTPSGAGGSVASTGLSLLASLGKSALVTVLAFSFIMALLDEKGLSRGIPGVGGASKHIQEADGEGAANGNRKKVKFDDVKGVTEAKAELEEIVQYLRDPSKFTRLGGTLPRGLLLTGPPGTGKTLLAKAIAGEADVPFFYSSGSQFEEVYVGLGAKRIRELFEAAKKKAPAIIFIDEIDAVGGTRRLKDQSALKMTLNELLVQLDGFDENNGIIVIGATNFMESLDTALLRPGRFDKHVVVPLPDVGGRKEILEMYASKTKLASDADLGVLARGTTGMSGADLYNLINQAALKASIEGLNAIDMKTLEYAKDKILMGSERKTAVITAETARTTAYHEAGHAIVALLTDGAMPVHKATIMPRGNSLGMVTMLPETDQTSQSYKQMIAFMDIAMGGRVAEELIFGKDRVTSGAASDIASATRLARNMVTKYGFSDAVGIVYHGGSVGEESASSETRGHIDAEVKRLTDEAYQRAKDLLQKYHSEHVLLAETLLEYETLTGDEVRDLVLRHVKPKRPIINKNHGARGDSSLLAKKDNSGTEKKDSKQQSSSEDASSSKRPRKFFSFGNNDE